MTSTTRAGLLDNSMVIGGAAGITFVALTFVGGVVQGDVPVYTQGPTTIKDWFAGNSDRYLVGGLLVLLGLVFYLAFLAALVRVFLRADERQSLWPWFALLAGIHLVVAAQASIAFDGTLALLEGDVPDDIARALSAGDYMSFLLLYPFAGIQTLAVSLSILRSGVIWRPLAWFGPLVAVCGLIAATAPLEHDAEGMLTTVGYVALFGFLVFTAGVSVSMVVAARRRPQTIQGLP
jgi:hypothetical protein